MGYTTGRKLTDELLFQIAKQYRTRSELQKNDPSVYATLRRRKLLDDATRHMVSVNFSLPQLACRNLLDRLLKSSSLYNSRKVVPPYEVDIYYPSLKLAVEYCGKGWHQEPAVVERDTVKEKLLRDKGIFLLKISETSRDYEFDIKSQIAENAAFLKTYGLTDSMVYKTKIDWDSIHRQTTVSNKIDRIKFIINNCPDAKYFRQNFGREYGFILRNNLHPLLQLLPRERETLSDYELIDKAKAYSTYADFVKSKYYPICHRRGLLKRSTEHMHKRNQWKHMSDDELISTVKTIGAKFPSDLKAHDPRLYWEIKRRKIRLWSGRKIKNDPEQVKARIDDLLKQNHSMGSIKKQYPALYSSYMFNKRKNKYGKEREEGSHPQLNGQAH